MPEDRGVVREIAWREIFPWLGIVRSARLALAPRLLLLAALGLFATAIGWRTIGGLFSDSDELHRPRPGEQVVWIEHDRAWPWESQRVQRPLRTLADFSPLDTPVVQTWNWMTTPFARMFSPNIGFVRFLYALLCGLWELAVWGVIGGAITRIAALPLARESRVGLVEGLRFAAVKWPQYVLAALLPLLGVVVLGFLVGVVYGLVMRADFGVLMMSFFWPLLLAASLVMAILLLGLLFGWALMWPTISVEGTDSFDALSRSYSYTFQRPLHYLFYVVVAGIIGLLAAYVVAYFVAATTELAFWSASWGAGAERIQEIEQLRAQLAVLQNMPEDLRAAEIAKISWSLRTGLEVLTFWTDCVVLVGAAYLYSYFWTAATAIYYLLRHSVDGTEPDEVAVEHEEETFGLPPLRSDSTGIPQVVEPKPNAE
jgi:hypothetical protein